MYGGINKDRHLCEHCQYRPLKHKGCDYFTLTGKCRPCDPEYCFLWMSEKKQEETPCKCVDIRIYENLANGIIERAGNNYVEANIKIFKISMKQQITKKDEDEIHKCERTISECRHFFNSDWFTELTDADGKILLDALNRRITETIAEMREKNEKRKV